MPLETKQVVIKGKTYTASTLPAMRGLRLLTKIGKVAGPAMAAGLDADLTTAARALFDGLDENEVENIIKALLSTVTVTDERGNQRDVLAGFDVEYSGAGLVDVFEVVKFALETNFGPIGAALAAAAKPLQPANLEPLKPPSE